MSVFGKNDNRFLTPSEVSIIIGRSESALSRDRSQRKGIEFYRIGGCRVLYRADDVQRAMNANPLAVIPLEGEVDINRLARMLRFKDSNTLRRWKRYGLGPVSRGSVYLANHVEAWLCCQRVGIVV